MGERKMKNFVKYTLLTLVLTFGVSTAAHAAPCSTVDFNCKPSAPEVDPSLAVAGFSLLAGTLTVLRARSRK
jgi:hypothetical protein